jgi:hypothetical protein
MAVAAIAAKVGLRRGIHAAPDSLQAVSAPSGGEREPAGEGTRATEAKTAGEDRPAAEDRPAGEEQATRGD